MEQLKAFLKSALMKLPVWARWLVGLVIAILSAILLLVNLSACKVSHMARQSSTTTITKSDGTTQSVSTTIEYNQSGETSK